MKMAGPPQIQKSQLPTSYIGHNVFDGSLPWGLEDCRIVSSFLAREDERALTLGVMRAEFLYYVMRERWIASNAHLPLVRALDHHRINEWPIKQAIAFGLGPIAGPPDDDYAPYEWKEGVLKSILQLIIFVYSIEYLGQKSGVATSQTKMFVQDPAFTAEDEAFFQTLNIQTLQLPEGETLVNSHTMVYAPHIPLPLVVSGMTRCTLHRPCLYIGPNIDDAIRSFKIVIAMYDHLDDVGKETAIAQLLAIKDETIMLSFHEPASQFESHAHSGTYVQVRRPGLITSKTTQHCTPSCRKMEGVYLESSWRCP